jgi:CheY-like chemotaxis protein
MKVLLVEDAEDDRIALRVMIEELGHQVLEATDGKQAVQVTVDSNPDFVLMDLSMPVVDGLQATAAIRAISRFPDRLPIVAMTAFQESLTEAEAFKAGCDEYLQKPIHLDDLGERVQETRALMLTC